MTNKKIAMLIAQADGTYQKTLIQGVAQEVEHLGFDLCIFTNFHVTDRHTGVPIDRLSGETSIFHWIPYEQFDGIILAPSTFRYDNDLRHTLQAEIASKYSGPVISLDLDSRYFEDVTLDDSAAIEQMICHLYEVHGYTDIAFLTGPMHHTHAARRLEGYKKGLAHCGIPFDENKIHTGNFWYDSGADLAEKMIRKGTLPQALVCSNEAMAIGAYRTFLTNGIRIPEDIALTGFDALDEGVENNYHITSMIRNGEDTGRKAARILVEKITGKSLPPVVEKDASFIIWDTCGCGEEKFPFVHDHSLSRLRPVNNERSSNFFSNYNYMLESLLACKTFDDLKDRLHYEFSYLGDFSQFSFCLDETWLEKTTDTQNLQDVYCEFEYNNKNGMSKTPHTRCKDILDFPSASNDCSKTYYFVPLHYEGIIFGYTVLSYEDVKLLPDCYSSWTRNLCTGLEIKRQIHAGRKENN